MISVRTFVKVSGICGNCLKVIFSNFLEVTEFTGPFPGMPDMVSRPATKTVANSFTYIGCFVCLFLCGFFTHEKSKTEMMTASVQGNKSKHTRGVCHFSILDIYENGGFKPFSAQVTSR